VFFVEGPEAVMAKVDLFEQTERKGSGGRLPLAFRMRPRTLEEFIGQAHILGPGKLLRRLIEADKVGSVIFYGPPGCGKSTLGHIICEITKAHFEKINAVASNVADMRHIITAAANRLRLEGKKTILFIDEIHRFNRAQQDVLMPDVESGNPILIGTTTHNPFFAINSPLLSRSHIFEFKALTDTDIIHILRLAVRDEERGLGSYTVHIDEEALSFLATVSEGDARRALNALEVGVLTTKKNKHGAVVFNLKVAEESIQKKAVVYDRDEDQHYDTISAFIKSMRGSDADAALYWMAKMIYAGEDPRFIARRIVICASEDVGNADPQALVIATSAMQAQELIGMPESRIILAQAAVYVACAPKSNAAYNGIESALHDVEEGRTFEVPDSLKDASYSGAKKLGRGQGYKYAHHFKDHFVKQEYIPVTKKYYLPGNLGYEKKIKEWMETLKEVA
jgi:putative ATPase